MLQLNGSWLHVSVALRPSSGQLQLLRRHVCKVCPNKYWFAQYTTEGFSRLVRGIISYGHFRAKYILYGQYTAELVTHWQIDRSLLNYPSFYLSRNLCTRSVLCQNVYINIVSFIIAVYGVKYICLPRQLFNRLPRIIFRK